MTEDKPFGVHLHQLPLFREWLDTGVPYRAAWVFTHENIKPGEIRSISLRDMLRMPNMGKNTVAAVCAVFGISDDKKYCPTCRILVDAEGSHDCNPVIEARMNRALEAFYLRCCGLKNREIGERLGVSANRAIQLWQKGRRIWRWQWYQTETRGISPA